MTLLPLPLTALTVHPFRRSVVAGAALMLLAACAPAPFERANLEEASAVCLGRLQAFDAAVDAAGLASADLRRIPGFPALRSDRFAASFRDELDGVGLDSPRLAAWFEHLLALGRQARAVEAVRLQTHAIAPVAVDRAELDALEVCAERVTAGDRQSPGAVRRLFANVAVPDDYRWSSRILGLYLPGGAWLFAWDAQQRGAELAADFAAVAAVQPTTLARLVPAPAPAAGEPGLIPDGALLPTPTSPPMAPRVKRLPPTPVFAPLMLPGAGLNTNDVDPVRFRYHPSPSGRVMNDARGRYGTVAEPVTRAPGSRTNAAEVEPYARWNEDGGTDTAHTDLDTDADLYADPSLEAEADTDADTDPYADPSLEAEADTDLYADPSLEAEADTDLYADPSLEAEADTDPRLDAASGSAGIRPRTSVLPGTATDPATRRNAAPLAGLGVGAGGADSAGDPRSVGIVGLPTAPARFPLPRDVLGIPRPDAGTLAALAREHAPLLRLVQSSGTGVAPPRSLPGAIVPSPGGAAPFAVDEHRPTVYVRHAFTRAGSRSLLQLEYTAWFGGLTPRGAGEPQATLDGIIWRVTLDEDGSVLLADVIPTCGCWHVAFPGPRLAPRRARLEPIDPIVQPIGLPAGEGPLELLLAVDTLRVVGLRRAADGDAPSRSPGGAEREGSMAEVSHPATPYALLPARELSTAITPSGVAFFGLDGIVPGTERRQRWWLWPSGVPAAGSPRQWNRQGTAFAGERHFDDADLIERHFTPRSGALDWP